MWRITFGLIAILFAAGPTAHADSTDARDRRAEAYKILLEAQSAAHSMSSPSDRNAVMTAVGQSYVRAGDETAAIAIDKKIATGEFPRPILRSLALWQLHAGRVDDALFTVRQMKDRDAADMMLMTMAEACDDAGDPEMAVRMCKFVAGETRLDALLLAARVQHRAADLEGSAASLDSAKLLAHRQGEVARVAETEALLGNLDRADKLMARLRRESDQARVLAGIVSVEAAAKDFKNADSHAADIGMDSIKYTSLGTIALAHAQIGQVNVAVEQINAIPDEETRMVYQRALTTDEIERHDAEAGRSVAMSCHDAPAKAVCLSIVAAALQKAKKADVARKTMQEAEAIVKPQDPQPPDAALSIVSENLAGVDLSDEALPLAARIKDSDLRADAIHEIFQTITRQKNADIARRLLEHLKDPREHATALVGIADALMSDLGPVQDTR